MKEIKREKIKMKEIKREKIKRKGIKRKLDLNNLI